MICIKGDKKTNLIFQTSFTHNFNILKCFIAVAGQRTLKPDPVDSPSCSLQTLSSVDTVLLQHTSAIAVTTQEGSAEHVLPF